MKIVLIQYFCRWINNFVNFIVRIIMDGGLDMSSSYQFQTDRLSKYRQNSISPDKFFAWQRDHMYKSTYNEKHGPNMNEPKNTAIPGYTGHVPGVKADSLFGKSNTLLARSSFVSEKLDVNRTGLASTGFNITNQALIDKSKSASSSKYGKTGLQRAHPNWSQQWRTTNQLAYQNPNHVPNPMYRNSQSVGRKQQNVNSGYSQNHAYLDGTGWKPHPVLTPYNIATQYRNRFNPEQQYHRNVDVNAQRKMRKSQLVYDYNF